MSQPQWQTAAGHLGTIPEGVFYQVQLVATDPANPLNPDAVKYRVIAGALPLGIQCTSSGLLKGVPYVINGINNVNSRFAIRAYTDTVPQRFADRTFDFTVLSQVPPVFVTPAGPVGQEPIYDGAPITPIQIEISDPNPGDNVVISLAAGSLPPGLSLSPTGLISGYIIPLVPDDQTPGFDATPFDQYPFDFPINSASKNYQFTLELNDGRETSLRTFEIYVYSRSSLTADVESISVYYDSNGDPIYNYAPFSADNTYITADETNVYIPFLVNAEPSNLGQVRSDNFWAYQFIGLDFDSDVIEYVEYIESGYQLPPGTTLDLNTGWLYGYLPDQGATENTYNFKIYVRKAAYPQYRSNPYTFSLTLVGPVNTDVTWLTDSDLGSIINGSTSTLYVEAVNIGGRNLQYQLAPGSYPSPNIGVYNKLPQGLELLTSGEIAGRVSFNTFALDLGATTFDQGNTTFDSKFVFTVNAYSQDGLVNVDKTFSITVIREYNEPYENLYIKCMPPLSDRALINQLIQNQDIIPVNLIYRPSDPNFGVAKNVIYEHAYGLTAATYQTYVNSLVINHYWKNLVLGEIKTAQALDDAGNVLYEVVYSSVIDDLVNAQGQSVSKSVTLPYPVNQFDSTEIDTVYPNSLINMRGQVIDSVGQISNILPRWMISKQANGKVLGFTPAWVICYCLPGKSGQVAYNIRQQYGDQLNRVDFEVDRYELDRLLTKNWNPVIRRWVNTPPAPIAETTFDLMLHYEVTAIGGGGGSGYRGIERAPNGIIVYTGDEISILGSQVGGIDGINDILVRVQEVGNTGNITLVILQGQAPLFSSGDTYTGISGTNITGTGTGATFDFVAASGEITTFDATSLRFESPVDMYSSTDEYDRYLLFPRRNILTPPTGDINPDLPVGWQNNTGQETAWQNDADEQVGWKDFI